MTSHSKDSRGEAAATAAASAAVEIAVVIREKEQFAEETRDGITMSIFFFFFHSRDRKLKLHRHGRRADFSFRLRNNSQSSRCDRSDHGAPSAGNRPDRCGAIENSCSAHCIAFAEMFVNRMSLVSLRLCDPCVVDDRRSSVLSTLLEY